MSTRPKIRPFFVLLLVLTLVIAFTKPAQRRYDAWRLARFAHRIAAADRIVGTYAQSPVALSFAGEDVTKVVLAVSSASPDRPPLGTVTSCSFCGKATFLKGTKVLDDIETCGSLFLIRHHYPPFQDESGVLDAIVSRPVGLAAQEAKLKQLENK